MNKNEIVLFETADNEVSLQVQMQDETVWLTQSQMVELFGRDDGKSNYELPDIRNKMLL